MLKVELERMQRLDIINEVTEPTDWVSPMVPVLKKNGQIGVCVDLSELNKAIKRDRFQIPVAEEIFARMKLRSSVLYCVRRTLPLDFGRFR